MQEILDETEAPISIPTTYSRLALAVAVVTVVLVLYLFALIPSEVGPGQPIYKPPPRLLVILTQIFCVMGFALTVASILRGERWSWYKVLGTVLNLVLVVFIIGLVIMAQVLDNS